jgi:hypothetical protein
MYMDMYRESQGDVEEFWDQEARELEWFRTWQRVLDRDPCMYARNSGK